MHKQQHTRKYKTKFKAVITSNIDDLITYIEFKVLPQHGTKEITLTAQHGVMKYILTNKLQSGDIIQINTFTTASNNQVTNYIKYITKLEYKL